MAIAKSQVVSVRVEPHIKMALKSAPECKLRSLANMLKVMVMKYCCVYDYPLKGGLEDTLTSTCLRGSAA